MPNKTGLILNTEQLELLHNLSGKLLRYKQFTNEDFFIEEHAFELPYTFIQDLKKESSEVLTKAIVVLVESTERQLINTINSITEGL